jgi:hypothetical protein
MPSAPHAKTVAKRVGQGPDPGRPAIVPYRSLTMSQDRSRMEGYRFLWQKIKPQVVQNADAMMDRVMPTNLMPQALRVIQARDHRRTH